LKDPEHSRPACRKGAQCILHFGNLVKVLMAIVAEHPVPPVSREKKVNSAGETIHAAALVFSSRIDQGRRGFMPPLCGSGFRRMDCLAPAAQICLRSTNEDGHACANPS
jgi:hypothetical protein